MMKRFGTLSALAALTALVLGGCGTAPTTGTDSATKPAGGGATSDVSGVVSIDGSSTVTPIFEAVAEEFMKKHPNARVTVATSGTGGGFKKFTNGEIEVAMASRPIKQEELDKATAGGIEFIELPIAFDGLSIVVNKENTWVDSLTVAELKKIWEPNSAVKSWKDVRAGFPDVPIKLYGAGTDSGTFDYFTLAINGKEKASRPDYTASEDDNILVQGVRGDKGALGYFGFAYYEQNANELKLVPVDGGKGPVAPSVETIANGTYQPLSRPLLVYIDRKKSESNVALKTFVDFMLSDGAALIKEVGYIPFPDDLLATVKAHWDGRKAGTVFKGAEVGVGVAEIMAREKAGS